MDDAQIRTAEGVQPGLQLQEDSLDGKEFMMGAVKVSHGVESPAGYLVIREFLHGPEERMGMILKVFFWALPIVALVCYGVIRFVTMQLSSSVESMVRTAEAVGQGNYKRRIRSFLIRSSFPLPIPLTGWLRVLMSMSALLPARGTRFRLCSTVCGMGLWFWTAVAVFER